MAVNLEPGKNDLESQFPALAREFDVELNFPLTPATVMFGSATPIAPDLAGHGNQTSESALRKPATPARSQQRHDNQHCNHCNNHCNPGH